MIDNWPTLTYNQVLPIAEAVVAERPDFIYVRPKVEGGPARCLYLDPVTDEPSCGVGVMLSRLGFTAEDLARLDRGPRGDEDSAIGNWLDNGALKTDKQTRTFLNAFQLHQDCGMAWHTALEYAKGSADRTVEPA